MLPSLLQAMLQAVAKDNVSMCSKYAKPGCSNVSFCKVIHYFHVVYET